jgi:hypothetical protein
MSVLIKDLFNSASQLSSVSSARDFISVNAKRVSSAAKPYTKMAEQNVKSAKSYMNGKIDEIRQADTLGAIVEVVVSIIITVVRLLVSLMTAVRSYILRDPSSRSAKLYVLAENYVLSIFGGMVGLPSLPMVKKVEGVSKKVLGDSRHDQAVGFIKTNVIDRVYEKLAPGSQKSPSGSSTADLTTEGGSVTGSSPRDETRRPKPQQRRK